MAFQVSPGINISEIDLTTVVPSVSTSVGAIAGVFSSGPINTPVLISSESELVQTFGKPTANNYETWFTAANFLAYSNALYVCRAGSAESTDTANSTFAAVGSTTTIVNPANHTIFNYDDYLEKKDSFEAAAKYIAKTPGTLGNTLKVSEIDSPRQYNKNIVFRSTPVANIDPTSKVPGSQNLSISVGSNTAFITISNSATLSTTDLQTYLNGIASSLQVGSIVKIGNSSIGTQDLQISNIGTATADVANAAIYRLSISFNDNYKLAADFSDSTTSANLDVYWEYYNAVDRQPGTSPYAESRGVSIVDEISIVVSDQDGAITGVPGTILEVYPNLSRATDAKSTDGGSLYYKDVINNTSKYIWVATEREPVVTPVAPIASLTASTLNSIDVAKSATYSLAGGTDGRAESAPTFTNIAAAYDVFRDTESYDISLLMAGAPVGVNNAQLANYLIDNIAEVRKDCVVFISPPKDAKTAQSVVNFRNLLPSSSYAFMDSGYKRQYDKYNDVYRDVPLNGDIAGLAARTDDVRDPWFSPAGVNRGIIKNIIKLGWNPDKASRDLLYKNGVNPVVTFPSQGTVLYGDKTLLKTASAFDRINVRRLFILLEKTIAIASQTTLFEFNDQFTRAQFKNLVEPFLRNIQGRRGIYDFRVVCDETNNTADVIDSNRFVGDIYIKPARSINFIQLNFVAVRSGVEFSEIVGQF